MIKKFQIIDREYLRVFDDKQLELVLSGTVEINMEDWRENTEYKGGYYDGHVVIRWFWNTVCSLSNADKLKLLQVCFLYLFKIKRLSSVCNRDF